MEQIAFRTLFFRFYDRKIAEGVITFSQLGIAKSDFTSLCTDCDFIPSKDIVEKLCITMKLTPEETSQMMIAAGYLAEEM